MGTYDKNDIKRIIKRAAELQQRSSGPESLDSDQKDLSLDEIQEIAREMGVSADFVREAALEYEGIPVEEPLFLDTGNKYEKELIGFVRGGMDKKTWAEMRSIIEYHFDAPGKVNRRPRGLKWKANPKGISKWLATRKSPEVEVKTEGNRTSIRLRKNLKTYRKLTWPGWFFLAVAFMIFTIMIAEGPGVGDDVVGIMMGIAASLGAAQLFRKWADRKVRKAGGELKEVMEQLQTIVARKNRAGGKRSPEWTKDLRQQNKESEESGRSGTGEETGSDRSTLETGDFGSTLRNMLKESPEEESEKGSNEEDGSRERRKERG